MRSNIASQRADLARIAPRLAKFIWTDRDAVTAARFAHVAAPSRLVYRCDAAAHCVAVSDQSGRLLFAFGSYGAAAGQFDTPLAVEFVSPQFDGEDLQGLDDEVWLAVADYGNRRVQVFELDGTFVGSVDDIECAAAERPCDIRWRAPMLDIVGVEGGHHAVHLAGSLFLSARTGVC